ncbi:MAG: ATP-binding cassette domain-containing protein, partial [SAR116 cluster bacterium]|nr:ATP-binding cassette domain-containing protein [SAR116 cluster bacterium]
PKGEPDMLCAVRGLDRPTATPFATPLRNLSFDARAGEVLGIAGIAGNGQDELMEALTGEWTGAGQNVITINGRDITRDGPSRRRQHSIGFVPEERNGHAAVPGMSLADNALLTSHSLGEVASRGVIDSDRTRQMAAEIAGAFDVRLPQENPMASALSGGNLQKFVVGREISKQPSLFIVSQPTWGVDVGAALFIRRAMLELAESGSAVVMISQDLEEIFAISHRVAVLHDGQISEPMVTADTTAETVGLLMGGSVPLKTAGAGDAA